MTRRGLRRRSSSGAEDPPSIREAFLRDYYDQGNAVDYGVTWKGTSWMGVPIRKCTTDLWLYQEIVYDLRPDVIVECGTAFGGSALYLAHLCDLVGNGRVVTIDIDEWAIEVPGYSGRPRHDRITYLTGSSVAPEIVEQVRAATAEAGTVMVVLDSDHRAPHVLEELRTYAPLVTVGSLLIVEDTMLNGHPVHPEFGDGPMEALDQYLRETDGYVVDPIGDKFLVSFNPRGYLRRVA